MIITCQIMLGIVEDEKSASHVINLGTLRQLPVEVGQTHPGCFQHQRLSVLLWEVPFQGSQSQYIVGLHCWILLDIMLKRIETIIAAECQCDACI